MVRNIRDGTGRDCFDMFGAKKTRDGTGRSSHNKPIFSWLDGMGRDSGCKILDGTGRYSTMNFFMMDGK